MSIGSTIRSLRESRRMTQGDLAKALSVTTQTVSSWELDNKVPRMGKLKDVAEYFGVDVASLVAGTDKKETIATYLFGTLTPEEQQLAIDYLHFVIGQRQRDKK